MKKTIVRLALLVCSVFLVTSKSTVYANMHSMSSVRQAQIGVTSTGTSGNYGTNKLGIPVYLQAEVWSHSVDWEHTDYYIDTNLEQNADVSMTVHCIRTYYDDNSRQTKTESTDTVISSWRQDTDTGLRVNGPNIIYKSPSDTIDCYSTKGSITNHSTQAYNGEYAGFVIGVDGGWKAGGYSQIDIPALETCSASVSDVDFGKVSAGDTATANLNITTSSVSANVRVTGNDMDDKGVLKLGGYEYATVQPTDSMNINADGTWTTAGLAKSIPLKLNVGSTAPGGQLTSNLTATLTCS
ncbi:hypothetical protein V5K00_RS23090 [Enterobacter asburiae]